MLNVNDYKEPNLETKKCSINESPSGERKVEALYTQLQDHSYVYTIRAPRYKEITF